VRAAEFRGDGIFVQADFHVNQGSFGVLKQYSVHPTMPPDAYKHPDIKEIQVRFYYCMLEIQTRLLRRIRVVCCMESFLLSVKRKSSTGVAFRSELRVTCLQLWLELVVYYLACFDWV